MGVNLAIYRGSKLSNYIYILYTHATNMIKHKINKFLPKELTIRNDFDEEKNKELKTVKLD